MHLEYVTKSLSLHDSVHIAQTSTFDSNAARRDETTDGVVREEAGSDEGRMGLVVECIGIVGRIVAMTFVVAVMVFAIPRRCNTRRGIRGGGYDGWIFRPGISLETSVIRERRRRRSRGPTFLDTNASIVISSADPNESSW
jgi:hypothetical protein